MIEFDRNQGIGGSDVPVIVGMSPYRSAIDLWEEKRGNAIEREPSLAMRLGTMLEDGIAKVYAEQEGAKITKPKHAFGLVEQRGRLVPHAGIEERFGFPTWAQVDRIRQERPRRGVEVKNTANLKRFGEGTPDDVAVQVQHAMMITGLKSFDVVSLSGGRDLAIDTIEADQDVQDAIRDASYRFWHEHVLTGVPPAPDGSGAASAYLRRRYDHDPAKIVVATHDSLPMIAEVFAAQKVKADAETALELAKQRVMMFMEDATRFEFPGGSITWKDQNGSPSYKGMAEDFRRIIEANADKIELPKTDDGDEPIPVAEWLDFIASMHAGKPTRTFRINGKFMALDGRKDQE